jgi:hemerythrin-like domain-containing protein
MSVTAPLQDHHHQCDTLFARAEHTAEQGDWGACSSAFGEFAMQMERHFQIEEGVLFPAFEAATGIRSGPTEMMRMEHGQMRGLLVQMAANLAVRDAEDFGGNAETLLILMQQHNIKEENILYPLCDRTLGTAVGETVAERMGVACLP